MNTIQRLLLGGAASACLVLASCAADDAPSGRTDGYVHFTTVIPPSITTRAFSDAQQATCLQYAVYSPSGDTFYFDGTATLSNGYADVKIPLAEGMSYRVLFYADAFGKDNPDSPYTFDTENGMLHVDYSRMAVNDEKYDAFYGETVVVVKEDLEPTWVLLQRPVAQINIGISEEDAAAAEALGITPASAAISLNYAYTTLDMLDYEHEVSDDVDDVEIAAGAVVPGESITVETIPYTCIGMAYVLGGDFADYVDVTVTLTATNGKTMTRTFTDMAYRRNSRTNIVGAILSGGSWDRMTFTPSLLQADNASFVYNINALNR